MTKGMKHALAAAAAFVLVGAADAAAQNVANANVTATATVAGRARLDISANAIAFADSDPTSVPTIPANAILNIDVHARTAPGNNVSLTVQAGGDFVSGGGDTIGIAALSWTATGAGFANGTAATTAVSVGSWTGPGARNGTQTYLLANSWSYAPGTYTVTLTYTLTAP